MHIVITGGAGFVGARLARTLLANKTLALAGASASPITTITLVDRVAPPADLAADPRVTSLVGDLNDLLAEAPERVVPKDAALVYHLAAAVSGECEADFDLGMRSNFAATHALLEACRQQGTTPTLVFSSSLAVFGNSPGAAAARSHRGRHAAHAADQLRHPEVHRRAAGCGLHAQELHPRPQRAADDSQRAAGPAERCGIGLLQRHDPRAARRPARRLPGAR